MKTVRRALGRDYSLPCRRSRSEAIDGLLAEFITANRAAFNLSHKNRLTPARAHELLCSAGFDVSLRTVERRFKVVSERLGNESVERAALRLDGLPGSWQVDFGMMPALPGDSLSMMPALVCSSRYSNACTAVLCRAQDASNLFWGLDSCFEQLDGVPPVLRFDNLSPAVSAFLSKRGRKKTDAFSRFEAFHGFESEFCNPARGNEKGNVENKVGRLRERFFVGADSFPALDDLNAALAVWCRRDDDRDHYRRGVRIADLLMAERACFLPYRGRFDFWDVVAGRTDKCGFVSYRSNAYFAGERSALRSVVVRASVDDVEIYTQAGDLLNTHKRAYASGKFVQDKAEFADQLSTKLRALGYAGRDRGEGLKLAEALQSVAVGERARFILRFLDGERLSDILAAVDEQRAPLFKYNSLLRGDDNGN